MTEPTSNTSSSVPAPNILKLLDFCKGIAIAGVVLFHYKNGWFGWQGVHIFIVLSGLGLTYSCLKKPEIISWKQWYLKRFEKILPTYWLVCILGFLIVISISAFKSANFLADFYQASVKLLLQLLILNVFYYKTMLVDPNWALWFIPLIVSFYLIFPWLYTQTTKHNTIKDYLIILLAAAVSEFIYRAISIYWLDGLPIAFDNGFGIFPVSVSPLNRLEDSIKAPFQIIAPFGLFPSRIAEFVLGMMGAIALVRNPQKFHKIILNKRVLITGIYTWLTGNLLLYVGLWGWVFADFIISLGLILWTINLAWIFQRKLSFLFLKISQLGSWSYYIFLTHLIFFYLANKIEAEVTPIAQWNSLGFWSLEVFLILFIIIGTFAASWLLKQVDNSRYSKIITKNTIGRFLK